MSDEEVIEIIKRLDALEATSTPFLIIKFLKLLYSLCRQYSSWYEKEIKGTL
jgi:hypothetical protein